VKKSGVSGALRRKVFARDGYVCQMCGLPGFERGMQRGDYSHPTIVPGVYLSIDHKIPRYFGGKSEIDNLQVLCVPCNVKKGISMPSAGACNGLGE